MAIQTEREEVRDVELPGFAVRNLASLARIEKAENGRWVFSKAGAQRAPYRFQLDLAVRTKRVVGREGELWGFVVLNPTCGLV
ncbi:MAG: hypothetical protein OXN17_18605 [Candidatus Poribacteria bacterium]|nr:hypothetical protein [Candidatus Poribacteria bacterium]MDE0503008.1 hypothetical protein [Candidatus Poribacteria bacterium]